MEKLSSRSVTRSSTLCFWVTSLPSSQQKFVDLISKDLWLEGCHAQLRACCKYLSLILNGMSIFIPSSESKNCNFISRIPATRFLSCKSRILQCSPLYNLSVQPKEKHPEILSLEYVPTNSPSKSPYNKANPQTPQMMGGIS